LEPMVHTGRNSIRRLEPSLRYETLHVELLLAYGTCKGFYPEYSVYFPSEKSPSEAIVDQMLLDTAFPLRKAFKELCKALGDELVPELSAEQPTKKRRTSNPKSQASKHPLVVLAFDEAHTLTEPQGKGSWSCFGEMRRAIRGLHTLSFFTLFISTSGTLFGITPTLLEGEVMLPFCEVGFDMFAQYVDFRETVKLSQITSEEHLTSYGRPLSVLNAYSVRLQLTFALDSLLITGRDKRPTYSSLQPRSCWVALHINFKLSQLRKSSRVLLNESLSNFSPLRMPRKYQTWRWSKSVPTCGSFSRLIVALRPWSPCRLLNQFFQRRHTL